MRKELNGSLILALLLTFSCVVVVAQGGQSFMAPVPGSISDYYDNLIGVISGDWHNFGRLFTTLQDHWFWKIFLIIVTVVPTIFFFHYLIIGAKHFDHDGDQILFFPLVVRIIHLFAAISFSLLVVTGLMIVCGNFFGGGWLIRQARYVHIGSALVFVIPCLLMFLVWFKEMLPQRHDLAWIIILGGYLSKQKKPVPAGKFNAGQKMYFWLATLGGGVMAFTGYYLWGMGTNLNQVRIFAIVHNVLGMGIVAFFLTHVYMSVFAIAGSLQSMKTGYKPKDEVDILHSRYRYD